MPLLSIVVVTHNASQKIASCLRGVQAQGFKDAEIIVVDSASQDNTRDLLDAYRPALIVIGNKDNVGPCKARNQGIDCSSSQYVLCLDDDVVLLNDSLAHLYKAISTENSIGAVGPKILLEDGKTIYSTGIYPSFLWRFYDIGSGRQDSPKWNKKRFVFGVSAACVLFRKEALDSIKYSGEYFDEDFFYSLEDVDISWRLQKKGWRIAYVPEAVCLHTARSSRIKSKISQYFSVRNRYLFLIKITNSISLWRITIAFLCYDLWRDLYMLVTNPRYFLKAVASVSQLFLRMRKKTGEARCA